MYQLDRDRDRQRGLRTTANRLRCRKRKYRTKPLPSRKEQMAHSALERFGNLRRPRKSRVDRSVDQQNSLRHVRIDIHSLILVIQVALKLLDLLGVIPVLVGFEGHGLQVSLTTPIGHQNLDATLGFLERGRTLP